MKFDLEHLKDMEERVGELDAEIKELEQSKSELQIRYKSQSAQERCPSRKRLKKRRDREPATSFFEKDHMGRNGIHKIGGFAWRFFFGFAIGTVISMLFVWPFYMETPEFSSVQLISRSLTCLFAFVLGVSGWKGRTKLSTGRQFFVGVVAIIFVSCVAMGYLAGYDVEDEIDRALTPDSWEE